MTTSLFRAVILAMLVFAGFETINCLDKFPAKAQASQKKNGSPGLKKTPNAAAKRKKVTVMFDGLMVVRRAGDHYELGVLDETTAPDHHFKISKNGKPVSKTLISQLLQAGNTWNLAIVSTSGVQAPPAIAPRATAPCNRLKDTMGNSGGPHAYDFCWMIDFENDFNGGKEVDMKSDKLKPIIRLNNGELYTLNKYPELRKDGPNGCEDYGFVTEILALDIDLADDQSVVLSVEGSKGPPAFELSRNGDRAKLVNAPDLAANLNATHMATTAKAKCAGYPSHFLYYYNLFNATPYDIYNKHNAMKPGNPFHKFTIPHAPCGIVYLGVSSGPLR